MEDEKVCQVCSDFEPQAWRKSLCRNCFHTLEDHADELLAAEASAVAQEKAAATVQTDTKAATLPRAKGKSGTSESKLGGKAPGKDRGSKTDEAVGEGKEHDKGKGVKPKFSKGKDGPWSGRELGMEYGKPSNKGPKLHSKAQEPSSETSNSSTLPKSSKSSSSSTTTPSTTSAESTSKKEDASKAKSVASKFESGQLPSSKNDKPSSKPIDLRLSSASVSALSGKLSKTAESDSKPSADSTSKGSEKHSASEGDIKSPTSSTPSKAQPSKSSLNGSDKGKEEKNKKDLSTNRSKAAPFGKDMLKSTKGDSKCIKDKENDKKETQSKQSSNKSSNSSVNGSKSKPAIGLKSEDKPDSKSLEKSSSFSQKSATVRSGGGSEPSTPADENKPGSVPGAGSSGRKEEKPEPGKANTAGQLAKYLPGKYGGDPPRADDVSGKAKGKTEEQASAENEAGLGSGGTYGTKTVERDKAPARDKDNSKPGGGDGAEGRTKVSEKERGDATSPNEKQGTPASESKQSSVGQHSSISKASGAVAGAASSAQNKSEELSSKTSSLKKSEPEKPKDLRLSSDKTSNALHKFKDLEKNSGKKDETSVLSPVKSPSPSALSKQDGGKESPRAKSFADATDTSLDSSNELSRKLRQELKEKEEKLEALSKQVSRMENEMKRLEKEKEKASTEASTSRQSQKQEMEKLLAELRGNLQTMEERCGKLQEDNESLMHKLHSQEETVRKDQENRGKNEINVQLEEDLEAAEQELEEVKDENKVLEAQIMEMKNEMDEMHDHFRENEHDEFRELQKELDLTAKNCRILQFKLRKSERRNEQIEEDRLHYEEKLRHLQDQFDSQDAKSHIQLLEEELRMAKEVSVRLHDELDIVEDKRGKALEENRHLTELLEHTDKRQFRLEMEIDKLRDVVQDLKMQLREARSDNNNEDDPSERKVPSYICSRSIID